MNVVGTALRRERVRIPIWAAVAGLLAVATASAVPEAFGDAAQRRALVEVLTATPSLLAIRGVPDGSSAGAVAFFQVSGFLGVLVALMSVFLVTRHTRADEEAGRTELVLAAPVRRRTPTVAALVTVMVADVAFGAAVTVGFAAGGLPIEGSVFAGAAVTAVGLAHAGVAAVVSELVPTGRAANGVGVGVVAGSYLLRAVGDSLGTRSADGFSVRSAWPSWVSPVGWGQHVFPYGRQDPWPIVLCLLLAVVGAALAVVVRGRRDLGAALLPERRGPATGRIRTSVGLAWRLHRSTVLAWSVGGAVLGLLAGTLGTTAVDALGSDGSVRELLRTFVPGGRGALLDEFVAAVVGIVSVLAAAAGIGALTRAGDDDRSGRSELLFGTPVGRVRRFAEWCGLAVLSSVVVAVAAGVVGGASAAVDDAGRFWSTLAAGLVQVPAALTVVAVAALVCVLLPRVASWAVWVVLGAAVVLGQFGGMLRVPEWARQISPFTHTPGLPAAHVDWAGAWWMLAVTVVIGIVTFVSARRQETRP